MSEKAQHKYKIGDIVKYEDEIVKIAALDNEPDNYILEYSLGWKPKDNSLWKDLIIEGSLELDKTYHLARIGHFKFLRSGEEKVIDNYSIY